MSNNIIEKRHTAIDLYDYQYEYMVKNDYNISKFIRYLLDREIFNRTFDRRMVVGGKRIEENKEDIEYEKMWE